MSPRRFEPGLRSGPVAAAGPLAPDERATRRALPGLRASAGLRPHSSRPNPARGVRPRRSRPAAGVALLIVLFLAAVVVIMMGMALPRVAFEAQRDKEDDLIYRGSQYSRGVQLFFRKNKRYPASMDDLEKFNDVRYLRRQYIDPITNKDEWRIVHIGAGGVFTDSLIYDKPKKPKKEGEPDTGTSGAGTSDDGATATDSSAPGSPWDPAQQQATGMADRLRGHGGQAAAGTGVDQFGNPVQPDYFNQGQFNQPGGQQPGAQQAGAAGGAPGFGGGAPSSSGGSGPPSPFGTPAGPGTSNPFGAQAGTPGTPFRPSYPGGPIPGNPGASAGGPNSPFGAGSQAAQILGQILTSPRPGGLNGVPGTGTASAFGGNSGFGGSTAFGGNTGFGGNSGAGNSGLGGNGAFGGGSAFGQANQGGAFGQPAGGNRLGNQLGNQAGAGGAPSFGGGIAGVASKSKARGIKEYKEHQKYNEWEFVYDYRKDPLLNGGAAMAGMAGQTGAGMIPGQPGAGMIPGQTGATSAFGQSGGLGSGSAFGQSGGSGFGSSAFGQPGGSSPSAFGQSGIDSNGQPAPVNPSQPGLSGSPFGAPRSGSPNPQQ